MTAIAALPWGGAYDMGGIAVSYKAAEPRINQRVVNETAVVVDYLNALGN